MVCFAIPSSDGFKARGSVAKVVAHSTKTHIERYLSRIEHLILNTIAIDTVASMQVVMYY